MKKLITIFLLVFLAFPAIAENADSVQIPDYKFPFSFRFIVGMVKNESKVGKQFLPANLGGGVVGYIYLKKGTPLFIVDKVRSGSSEYYKAYCDDKWFYIDKVDVLTDALENREVDTLLRHSPEIKENLEKYVAYYSPQLFYQYYKPICDQIATLNSYGLNIVEWSVHDESRYTDGTGIKFEFYNPTKKTIKYITINYVGYNAVDDKVSSGGKYTQTSKCVGPIEPGETATYEFEYVWFTDIVEYAKLVSIKVQYRDGTMKTYTHPNKIVWKDGIQSYLDLVETLSYL